MQISALGTEDEIFEQVRPLFAACEVCFTIDIYLLSAYCITHQEFAPSYHLATLLVMSSKIGTV